MSRPQGNCCFPLPFPPSFPLGSQHILCCHSQSLQSLSHTGDEGQGGGDCPAFGQAGRIRNISSALGMPGSPECPLCHLGSLEGCPLLGGADGAASASTGCPCSSTRGCNQHSSTISLSKSSDCTEGMFRDILVREKRGNRARKGAAQPFCQQLVQCTLRVVCCTATSERSIPCTHLGLKHLQGSRTLAKPWPLGRCPLLTEIISHPQSSSAISQSVHLYFTGTDTMVMGTIR